jgi:hypothetical protein
MSLDMNSKDGMLNATDKAVKYKDELTPLLDGLDWELMPQDAYDQVYYLCGNFLYLCLIGWSTFYM